jgi:septum site-determining protein MinD
VGKSFIAVNLAASIAAEIGQSVLLVDCGLPFSTDLASYLELPKIRSLAKLLPFAHTVDQKLLKNYPTVYRNNISVLGLVQGELETVDFDPDFFTKIQELIRKVEPLFDIVIMDLGLSYGAFVEYFLDRAEKIILPFDCEPLALMKMATDIDFLKQRNFSKDVFHVVLNKYRNGAPVTPELAEQRLQKHLAGIIPYDEQMSTHFASGKIFPFDFPDHPISKALSRITLQLLQAGSGRVSVKRNDVANEEQDKDTIDLDYKNRLKLKIHDELLEILDLKKLDVDVDNDPEKLQELQNIVRKKTIEILDRQTSIKSRIVRDKIVKEVLQESLGLGPLEDLLDDPEISEIMVTKWDKIYVERAGKLQLVAKKFLSENQLQGILERIVAPLGRRIDASSPMVDARLKDGSRVNAVIPPLAVGGTNITIRKFGRDTVGIQELIRFGSLNQQVAEFLKAAVKCRLNIIVSGGTGSGKTTLLNILSSFIPEDERIITIEDSAELQLRQPHIITLESRPPNIEGSGEVTIRDLVRNSLRMRPDRIVVGECRAGEALDMLQAMNTGHDGSLTTLHANSTRESLGRLETLVMFAGFELPIKAIREQIVGAIDIIVQLTRLKDGSRKIVQVSEVTGMEGDIITMGDIYVFEQEGMDENGKIRGNFISTGYTPRCLKVFEERGVQIPREMFWTTT